MKWKLVPVEATSEMAAKGFVVPEAEHDPSGVYRAMLASAPEPEPCVWSFVTGSLFSYETGCGNVWIGTEPGDGKMKFCCYCGHPIEVREHE